MYNITFQQIEAFLMVARYLNMTRAAEKLYVSQPTLSKTLQRFEKGVGFPVFNRSNQGMSLTEQGECLYQSLDIMYGSMEAAIDRARDLDTAEKKRLRLVLPSAFDSIECFEPLRKAVERFRERYPEVIVEESLCDYTEMKRKIDLGAADLVFAYDFIVESLPDACSKRVCLCTSYLAMAADHPLAREEKLSLDQLRGETMYMMEGGSDQREMLTAICERMGFRPKEIVMVSNFITLMHMIQKREGLCLCPKLEGELGKNLRYYALDSLSGNVYYSVAWYPEKLSVQARNFLKLL